METKMQEEKPKKEKSAAYARVSSKEQEETGYSLPAQEKLLRDYTDRAGFLLEKVFSIHESANGTIQRKIFHEMMRFVVKNKINIIVVETTDRLTRNFADVPTIDNWLLEDEAHQIHLVKEGCILHKNSKSHEWFMWRVKVATAEYYIRLLSENVKKGQKEKLAQGWLPTKPPLGYKTIGEKGHKTHVIDEVVAPIIQKMFKLYASNKYSVQKLTNVMYENGLRGRSGRRVYKSRIHKLLSNPFYYGTNQWKGKITPGEHEPIIAKELFMRVQEIMRHNTAPKYSRHNSLFKGVFDCEECGGKITWELQKGKWYGHCNHYRNCTQKVWIKQNEIDAKMADYVFEATPKDERVSRLLGWVQDALKEGHADEIGFRDKAIAELERQYQKSLQRLDQIYDDKIDGRITQEFYDRKYAQYKKEQEEVMDSLNRHKNANLKYFEMGIVVLDVAKRARDIYLNPNRTVEDKRTLLSFLFSNPTINNGNITISYRKPFDLIHNRLQELMTLEKTEKRTFEPPKKPTNKGKSTAFGDACPVMLRRQDSNLRPMRYT